MKAATLLGALALAAALYTFLFRFWGGMSVALQAGDTLRNSLIANNSFTKPAFFSALSSTTSS